MVTIGRVDIQCAVVPCVSQLLKLAISGEAFWTPSEIAGGFHISSQLGLHSRFISHSLFHRNISRGSAYRLPRPYVHILLALERCTFYDIRVCYSMMAASNGLLESEICTTILVVWLRIFNSEDNHRNSMTVRNASIKTPPTAFPCSPLSFFYHYFLLKQSLLLIIWGWITWTDKGSISSHQLA